MRREQESAFVLYVHISHETSSHQTILNMRIHKCKLSCSLHALVFNSSVRRKMIHSFGQRWEIIYRGLRLHQIRFNSRNT